MSFYGNTFIFGYDTKYKTGALFKNVGNNITSPDTGVYVLNNTFYGYRSGFDSKGGSDWIEGGEFKYNILVCDHADVYFVYRFNITYSTCDSTYWTIDSNIVVYPNAAHTVWSMCGASWNWSQWQGAGFDENSTFHTATNSVGFNDYANNDFSRPSASGEMDKTYGGKTWTIYGAVQPASVGAAGKSNKLRGVK